MRRPCLKAELVEILVREGLAHSGEEPISTDAYGRHLFSRVCAAVLMSNSPTQALLTLPSP